MEPLKRKSQRIDESKSENKKKSNLVTSNILKEYDEKKSGKKKSVEKREKSLTKKEESSNNIEITSNKTIQDKKSKSKIHDEENNWKVFHNSVLVKNYDSQYSDKILAFDLDDTLVHPKSGGTFSKHKDDWTFIFDISLIKNKIKEYYDKGYRIVILSNQSGIRKGKANEEDWKNKVDSLQKELNIPLIILAALESDFYRKPSIGMWKLLQDEFNNETKIYKESSFYVGDAAGRNKNWKGKKDHSDSDLKFAINAGIKFITPEELFKSEKVKISTDFDFNPKNLKNKNNINIEDELNLSDKQEMIILVGSPASGKSTLVHNYLIPKGYVHVNNDTLKTAVKCHKLTEESLKEGKCVVIDNTNPTKAVRQSYISIAQKHNIPIRCLFFKYPKNLTFHLNNLRQINLNRKHQSKSVPDVVIHSWYKNLEEPTISEGFKEVKEIPFIPGPFENDLDEEIFYMYSSK